MSTRNTSFTALILALAASGTAHSADPIAPSRAPAYVIQAGGICSPCEAASAPCATGPCASVSASPKPCENNRRPLAHLRPAPTSVSLCPGGCFGYFPTQWRSWDAACGYVHHGAISPSPSIPPSYDMPPKNGQIPAPRSSNLGTRIK